MGLQAMKIFSKRESPDALEEAYLLTKLSHPNIVRMFEANEFQVEEESYGYFTMEYVEGGTLADYKSAKFILNDDIAIHPHGDLVWATATVKEEMTTKAGKVEMGTFRWTVIFESEDGKWLIVHEHVSAPIQ